MGRIWSEENKYRMWLEVEATASEVLADAGIVPHSAARAIRAYGEVDVARIQEIEAEVKHDVIAFTTAMAEKIGPESRWLHYGLTSNDVVDTAQALQIKAASGIIRQGILALAGDPQAAGPGVQAHSHDRPHPRHPCRAHHLRAQTAELVCRDHARPGALRCERGRHACGQALRRGRHVRSSQAGARSEHLRQAGTARRPNRHPGDPARPPRRLHRHPRGAGFHAG